MFYIDDDNHVYGVRLRLWTAATNGSIIHSPRDIWSFGTMMEWYRQGKLLIRPPEFSGNRTSSHPVATQEYLAKEVNSALQSIFVHTSKGSLTCREILLQETDGFTSPLKEGVLQIFVNHYIAGDNYVLCWYHSSGWT
jgi:hypothetical protein